MLSTPKPRSKVDQITLIRSNVDCRVFCDYWVLNLWYSPPATGSLAKPDARENAGMGKDGVPRSFRSHRSTSHLIPSTSHHIPPSRVTSLISLIVDQAQQKKAYELKNICYFGNWWVVSKCRERNGLKWLPKTQTFSSKFPKNFTSEVFGSRNRGNDGRKDRWKEKRTLGHWEREKKQQFAHA